MLRPVRLSLFTKHFFWKKKSCILKCLRWLIGELATEKSIRFLNAVEPRNQFRFSSRCDRLKEKVSETKRTDWWRDREVRRTKLDIIWASQNCYFCRVLNFELTVLGGLFKANSIGTRKKCVSLFASLNCISIFVCHTRSIHKIRIGIANDQAIALIRA